MDTDDERIVTHEDRAHALQVALNKEQRASALRIRELLEENERLEKFACAVIRCGWSFEQIDSGDIQELALKVGLIREAPGGYDPAKHGDDAFCDPGDEYYELTIGGEVDGG